MPRLRQGNALGRRHLGHKPVGHLQQNARSIAAVGFGSHGTPVGQVDQNGEPLLHDTVGRCALHVNDETNAAGIVLVLGMVKTLGLGRLR